jgi:hypothetical protein
MTDTIEEVELKVEDLDKYLVACETFSPRTMPTSSNVTSKFMARAPR